MDDEKKSLVLEQALEAGVKFVRLQFTDIHGLLKNMAIPVDQLNKALDSDLMFDGWVRVHDWEVREYLNKYLNLCFFIDLFPSSALLPLGGASFYSRVSL